MKKKITLVLVLALALVAVSPAAEYTWAQKVDMPTARVVHSASVVDGKIYAIGGQTSEPNPVAVWPVEVYDPIADSWTQKANIPTGRAGHSTSVVDGKIYVVGGYDESGVMPSTVREYDPATDTWTIKADLPTPRSHLASSVVDGKIYAIGGFLSGIGRNTVEEYDPVTDTWTRKANMPFGVWGLCTTVVDGKIYALGGRPDWQARPYVQEYDPATDTWTRKSDMPVVTSQMGSVVLGDKIIVIGGWLWSADYPYTAVQMYDPETDIWTIEGDAPFLRAAFSASVVNNRIYAIGGTDRPHPCPATSTVYELTISPPAPDFNGDGKVDFKDFSKLAQYWRQNERSVDIAPPIGNGIVDVQDVAVLAEYWLQEVDLFAHWTLDETAGTIAHDSAGNNDGTLQNSPTWQPTNGKLSGALQFDGIDDYISTPFVLNPADAPFSVFVWVKGSVSGQVILSQAGSANWLSADPSEGKLMTDLAAPAGRFPPQPLASQCVITDGDWHRIGFTWDGSNRILYVDDVEVAKDTQSGLASSQGGLYIGAGKNPVPPSLWLGLLDDIRIYDRAMVP